MKEYCSSSIKYLNLSGNPIDDECMDSLGELICDSQSLETIDFSSGYGKNNNISDDGVKTLSCYIIGNLFLKNIFFSYCKVLTEKSVPYLKEMASKSCLNQISLYSTQISYNMQNEIDQLLSIPTEQREIPIFSSTKSASKSSSI